MDIKPNKFECSIAECDKKVHSRGMCQSHYRKERRNNPDINDLCSWDGCDSARYCQGMCAAHYQWSRVNGKFETGTCSVDNCETHSYAKGYCPSHYWILSNYKLKPETYEEMRIAQNNRCATCNSSGKLHVDHNHITGIVRELLCTQCNTALGLIKENKETLNELIKYIKKHSD